MRYESTLASGTIAPESIRIAGHLLRPGMSEERISVALGKNSSLIEDWQVRDAQQQCDYLLALLRRHPDSMHLYKLGELKLKRMAGAFRVVEWQLPQAGTLRAHVFSPQGDGRGTVYLYQFTMQAPGGEVRRQPGKAYVVFRTGPRRVEWDVDGNRLSIGPSAP
jgi:hypothetical protein